MSQARTDKGRQKLLEIELHIQSDQDNDEELEPLIAVHLGTTRISQYALLDPKAHHNSIGLKEFKQLNGVRKT